MTTRSLTKSQAISIAIRFLDGLLPNGSPPSHIAARHVYGDELVKGQKDLQDFFAQHGQHSSELLRLEMERMGLTEDHWSVQFYAIEEPGFASTTPPTIVRVFDADGRAELSE